ncbi:MAG: FecR domain-containing protein [Candidatus Riflebacteria bacterium]|nr:FecR domain-containing protein [Candidatus Riflebacteria bacterium]
MKKVSVVLSLVVVVVSLAFVYGCGSSSTDAAKTKAIALIERVENGEVFLKRATQTDFSKADPKTELFPGDVVRTSKDSEALIRFRTGAVTRVLAESEFMLKELKFAANEMGTVYTKLAKGIAYFYVPKGSTEAKKFEVETERAIASIKGTTFKVSDDGNFTTLSVASGVVNLAAKSDGKSIDVEAFQEAKADNKGLSKHTSGDIMAEGFLKKFNFLSDQYFSDLTLGEVGTKVLKGTR